MFFLDMFPFSSLMYVAIITASFPLDANDGARLD